MRQSILVLALLGALAAPGAAQEEKPREEIIDFRGKGVYQIKVRGLDLILEAEQAYLRPNRIMLATELLGAASSILMDQDVERTYSPQQGIVVEKRFRNLERLSHHPSLAVQMSMITFRTTFQSVPGVRKIGQEMFLNFPCEVVEVENKPLLQQLRAVNGDLEKELGEGKTRAWLTQAHRLPVKIEVYNSEGKPAILFGFTELKINTGLRPSDLRPSSPRLIPGPKVPVITVTVDVTQPDWEKKMEREIQNKTIQVLRAQMRM